MTLRACAARWVVRESERRNRAELCGRGGDPAFAAADTTYEVDRACCAGRPSETLSGQVTEGQWGMPGHTEARKAAVSCDKPGGGAHTL